MKLSDLFNPPKLIAVPIGTCKCGEEAIMEMAKLTPTGPINPTKLCQKCFDRLLTLEPIKV
jgi:hypothetical protein